MVYERHLRVDYAFLNTSYTKKVVIRHSVATDGIQVMSTRVIAIGPDSWFYASFGVAITMAVPIAGVLLVFTFLVIPSVIAFLFTRRPPLLLAVSWMAAAFVCAAGLLVSFKLDLPTGPLIICMFGLALSIAGVVSRWAPAPEVS